MKLFIDTTNWQLCLLLINSDNHVAEEFIQKDTKKVSDITMDKIVWLLNKHNLKLKDIKNFYVTQGPGSYTGVRVGLTIVKTLKILNEEINVYLINSLTFQAGIQKAISLLDARSNKSYCGIYDNQKIIKEPFLLDNTDLSKLENKYKNFKIISNYENIDFKKNVITLINNFQKVKNTSEIIPIYIKSFV